MVAAREIFKNNQGRIAEEEGKWIIICNFAAEKNSKGQ